MAPVAVAAMSNGEGVTYTVKELLTMLEKTLTEQMQGIARSVNEIKDKLDDKASNTRVLALEERVGRLELTAAGSAAVTTFQRWLFGTVAVGILGAIATLVWLASGGH